MSSNTSPQRFSQALVVRKMSEKIENFENFGTDLGWFGGEFGMVWGYFLTDFEKNEKLEV